jgi:hypothetical protein
MKPDRQVDLVPPLAIVAGAVVSVVVTYLAFMSGGDAAVERRRAVEAAVPSAIVWEEPVSAVVPAILYWPESYRWDPSVRWTPR